MTTSPVRFRHSRLLIIMLAAAILLPGCAQEKRFAKSPKSSASAPRDDKPEPAGATAEPADPASPANDEPPGDSALPPNEEFPGDRTASLPRRKVRRDGQRVERRGYSAEHVFYATNRAPEELPEAATDPDLFFSGERGPLSYGLCEVSIPYRRQPGTLPEPNPLLLEFTQDPAEHVVLLEISQLPDAEFWEALRAKVDESADRQMLVFIHGYCATFRDAARRTAQIAYDLNYQGPAMFFSWPAGSDTESFEEKVNYLKDLRRAEQSDEDLMTVLNGISRYSGAARIHLVAHSMGNFVLTEALKTMDDRHNGSSPPMVFDQVALAAPDLDAAEYVERTAARLKPFSRRFTVYASAQDRALQVSRTVNAYEPLGFLNRFSQAGASKQYFDLVDASQMTSGWFDSGHIYYGDMPEVLRDFGLLFQGLQAAAPARGLTGAPPLFRLKRQ